MAALRSSVLALACAVAAPAQDFVDLPWRVDERGRLEMQTCGDGVDGQALRFGEWMPAFGDLFEVGADGEPELASRFARKPFELVPLLVHGAGGAAAIEDATRRLRRLGLGVTIDWTAHSSMPADPLLDLLRVRHLASVDLPLASMVLYRVYAQSKERDTFVRAAAGEALVEAQPEILSGLLGGLEVARDGAQALRAGLSRMPDDIDLVLGVHGAALGRRPELLAAWRQGAACLCSSVALALGPNTSPVARTRLQLQLDLPAQLPYELAVHFGNFRVDYALMAARRGERLRWWLHLGGVFQPAKFAAGIRAAGGVVAAEEGGSVLGTLGGYGVRVTATACEAWHQEIDAGARGAWSQRLGGRAARDEPPVWLHAPATSAITKATAADGCTVDVTFRPEPRGLVATLQAPDEAAATRALATFRAWQAGRSFEDDEELPRSGERTWADVAKQADLDQYSLRLTYRRAVLSAQARRDGSRVDVEVDLTPYSLTHLVSLLSGNPVRLLTDG